MGDPGKLRRKYSGPGHPWQKARIEEEKALKKEYGLKNKSEIWKQDSKLKNFANQAKRLVTLTGAQADKERKQLLERLVRLGLVSPGATTEEVLSLSIKDILERRLQTMVYRKGLARSQTQARQYISHGHITIAGKKMKTPSYLVTKEDESQLAFVENSALANIEHPERALPEKKPEVVEVKTDDRKFGRRRVQKRFPRKSGTKVPNSQNKSSAKIVKKENKPKEGQTKK